MDYARSVPEIFIDLINQATTLVRKESELARVEVSEKLSQIGSGLGLVIGGAVLVMPALVILLEAAVAGLQSSGMAPYWAAAIVGGGVLVIGLVLLAVGASRVKARNLVPNRTLEQFQRDASVAKQQMGKTYDSIERAA
jgi:putative superfamily III holin-X